MYLYINRRIGCACFGECNNNKCWCFSINSECDPAICLNCFCSNNKSSRC